MTDAKLAYRAAGVGRLGTAAAWISAVCCLPYLVLKLLWTLGIPVGIADRSVLDSDGWVAANAVMAVIQLAGLVLVLALARPWARRLPAWLVLFPAWVGTGLLFQIVVGAVLTGLFSPASPDSSGSTDLGDFQPWVFVLVYSAFAGQGVALAIAFACHVRTRWGRLLGQSTYEVVETGNPRAWLSPDDRLAELAEAVAWMALAVAVVCWYWAAGGSLGLSGTQRDPSWAMQASGVAGAVTAVVGLLALAGRWGQHTRFWLPVALTWVGSGAVAAFDGLNLLFLVSTLGGPDADWSLIDTILMVKVVIGLLAGAVGVLAVTAAADRQPGPSRNSPQVYADAEQPREHAASGAARD